MKRIVFLCAAPLALSCGVGMNEQDLSQLESTNVVVPAFERCSTKDLPALEMERVEREIAPMLHDAQQLPALLNRTDKLAQRVESHTILGSWFKVHGSRLRG